MPWLLVVLVSAGAGLGVGFGLASQSLSAQAQISQILRKTESAGTARFTTSSVTTVQGTRVRTRIVASGEIDFKADAISLTLHFPSADPHATPPVTMLKIVDIGNFQYEYVPTLSTSGPIGSSTKAPITYSWQKEPLRTGKDHGSSIVNSPMDLLQVPGTIQTLRDDGTGFVGGKKTTEYQIGPSTCRESASGLTQIHSTAASTLWVDNRDRLIQDDVTQTVVIHAPKGFRSGLPKSIEKASIHLFDFGKPVEITAPARATVMTGASAYDACS